MLTFPQHPSLRAYKHQLALLQAQLSHWQHKTRFARTQIRNLISSLLPTDPPYMVYSAHLLAVTLFTTPDSPPSTTPSSHSTPKRRLQDVHSALNHVKNIESISVKNGHAHVTILAHILRLRILVAANMWKDVAEAVQSAESILGLTYEPCAAPKTRPSQDTNASMSSQKEGVNKNAFVAFDDPFEATMAIHLLIITVIHYTYVGSAAEASPRLSHLHSLLDSGALDKFPHGSIEVINQTGVWRAALTVMPIDRFALWSSASNSGHTSARLVPFNVPSERCCQARCRWAEAEAEDLRHGGPEQLGS